MRRLPENPPTFLALVFPLAKVNCDYMSFEVSTPGRFVDAKRTLPVSSWVLGELIYNAGVGIVKGNRSRSHYEGRYDDGRYSMR